MPSRRGHRLHTPPPPLSTPSGTATGTVLVNGKRYASGRPIPYGSKVNVTGGRLTLKTELGTVTAYGDGVPAVFRLVRLREPSDMIGLRLVEGSFNTCGKNTAAEPVRRLWARLGEVPDDGPLRDGDTARAGWWLTADSCSATRIRARQGSVTVRI